MLSEIVRGIIVGFGLFWLSYAAYRLIRSMWYDRWEYLGTRYGKMRKASENGVAISYSIAYCYQFWINFQRREYRIGWNGQTISGKLEEDWLEYVNWDLGGVQHQDIIEYLVKLTDIKIMKEDLLTQKEVEYMI